MDFKERIEELRKILMTGDDFSKIFDYFMTHLGENPEFMGKGKPVKNKYIRGQLELIGKQYFKDEKVSIQHLLLIQVKGTKFIHGPFFLNGLMGNLFYFTDINMGLFSLYTGKETLFIRITSSYPGEQPGKNMGDDFGEFGIDSVTIIPSQKSRLIH